MADQQRRAASSEHKAPLQDPTRGSTSNLGEDDSIQISKGGFDQVKEGFLQRGD